MNKLVLQEARALKEPYERDLDDSIVEAHEELVSDAEAMDDIVFVEACYEDHMMVQVEAMERESDDVVREVVEVVGSPHCFFCGSKL